MPKTKNHSNIIRRNDAIVKRYDALCVEYRTRHKRLQVLSDEFYMNLRAINQILKSHSNHQTKTQDGKEKSDSRDSTESNNQ
jgi:hypothetical protein